jgi:Holliday junction resolvasome RuvABC endonuclease subunit
VSEHVWAVDPAVSRMAFAFADLDTDTITVETLTTTTDATEGERWGLLDRQVRIFARERAGEFPPSVVWVEQPSGQWRNLPLTYAVGVLQAALFEALGVPVWTMPTAAWKQRSVGRGNVSKQEVRAWVEQLGVPVESQDEADAVALAFAGRLMVRAGAWQAGVPERESRAQRVERERGERLAEIDQQVRSGELVVRRATAEERERYGLEGDDG